MNNEKQQKARIEHLEKASLHVRNESMQINAEFNRIEQDPKKYCERSCAHLIYTSFT